MAGPQPDREGVRDDRAQHVAGLGDDGDRVLVGRIDGPREEAVVVGRLEEHLDRRRGPGPEVVGEPGRRHQHEVGGVELVVLDRLGVADDPEHVALAGAAPNRLQAPQHQVHVTGPSGRIVGPVRGLEPDLVTEPAQPAASPSARCQSPHPRDLGRRRGDGDGEPERVRPRPAELRAPAGHRRGRPAPRQAGPSHRSGPQVASGATGR